MNNMFLKFPKNNNRGFVALTSVILLTAVLLFVVTSLSLQVLDEAEISSAYEQSKIANSMVDACAEYVLLQISNNPAYAEAGDSPQQIEGYDCDFSFSGDYPDKLIQIWSQIGENLYTAKTLIDISTTTPSIVIDSWDKNADF